MGFRTCIKCNTEKLESDFPDVKLPTRIKRSNICRKCKYVYHQRYNKKKNRVRYTNLETQRRVRYKEEAIRLLGGQCADCKQTYPTPVYDFHHIDPDLKENNPAKLLMGSWEKLEAELKNCVLLCANCHRIRHFVKEFPTETTISKEQGESTTTTST